MDVMKKNTCAYCGEDPMVNKMKHFNEFFKFMGEKKDLLESMASEMGKASAKARKKIGHDKKYYSELAKKRWSKPISPCK